jgi:DNA-binding LacI/PurR family transcriptional regulator
MMDGIILVSPPIHHPIIDELIDTNTKFVSADRIERTDTQVNFITVENVQSSRRAVQHLIDLGHKRIVNLAGYTNVIDSRDRIEGYRLALQDAGIPYDPNLLKVVAYEQEGGYKAIQELLSAGIEFDAVYANQSDIALGATNGLLDAGIRLPDDVALIGFDDLSESSNPRIGISTMHHPVFEKGQELVHTLIDLIEEKIVPPIQRFLPTELIVRDTCGGLKEISV